MLVLIVSKKVREHSYLLGEVVGNIFNSKLPQGEK